MSYAIVYSSKTGNTKILADTLHDCLPQADCCYFGSPNPAAMEADTLYVGFWTDKGQADESTSDFLKQLHGKNIFLFGTAGFGGSKEYFDKILKKTEHSLDKSNTVFGRYMCQGKMPMSLYISQWLLVGICTLALPQSVVRGISYKNTKALHNAMLIGTITIGAMTLVATWIGVLSKGILTDTLAAYGNSVDNITPLTIVKTMGPLWAGITIIGPIAATVSTVSSLLLSSSSSIIKDVYMREMEKRNVEVSNDKIKRLSMLATVVLGLIVYVVAIAPPSVIWQINMFAFGGLETAFFWVLLFGLFWPKANRMGAILAMLGGVVSYCVCMAMQIKVFDLHQIVIGIGVSLILFLIGTCIGKAQDEEVLRVFFPERYPD